ncbi:hypothetical protein [Streptomyces sp. NBC_00076]|uniref:hypothetical protein n=1 Tax=Streptomyces sp. NBC_00076 TaxID=2975642 RepID=UPI00324E4043
MSTLFTMPTHERRHFRANADARAEQAAEQLDAEATEEQTEWVTLPDGSREMLVLPPADDLITYLGAPTSDDDD